MADPSTTLRTGLTVEDINVLIEALEAWKEKDASVDLFDSIIESALGRGREMPAKVYAGRQERAAAKAIRKERAIVLQAKLIEMRMHVEREGDSET